MIYPGIRSEIGSAIRTAHDRVTVVRSLEAQIAVLFTALGNLPKLWLDPSDPATRFQDLGGTTALTTAGQGFGRLADKSGGGNHVGQAATASMPLYRTDGVLHWAEADGTNDGWQSLANFDASGVNKLTLIVGLRKRSDAAAGVLAELGPHFSTPGSFGVFTPPSNGAASYQVALTGATTSAVATASGAAPDRAVLTIPMDLSAATASAALSIQRNSDASQPGSPVPGARNFIAAVLNLMRRNNASTPAAVDLFGLMIIPSAVSAADLLMLRTFMAGKAGVTL